jgi:2-polyprenyl-3-methyl-5-hydroxy-6-metoxy-1,4-benzoquinol methylase
MPSALHNILNIPLAYRLFQEKLGFADARRKAFVRWLAIDSGAKVIDIGCGPGHILEFLSDDIDYIGFDVDEKYIQQARRDYGHRAQFHHRIFDHSCLPENGNADVVMLNGVLHHMSDEQVAQCLSTARAALQEGGVIFTLDGCYQKGQSRIAKILLDLDRGQHIRRREEYEALMSASFPNFKTHMANDLSTIPYTFIVLVGER